MRRSTHMSRHTLLVLHKKILSCLASDFSPTARQQLRGSQVVSAGSLVILCKADCGLLRHLKGQGQVIRLALGDVFAAMACFAIPTASS